MEHPGKSKQVDVRSILPCSLPSGCMIAWFSSSDTSLTDAWSRMISYHFLNQTTRSNFFTNDTAHGAGQLWSQIQFTPSYQQFAAPFPIIYANSRPVGSNDTGILSLDSIVYEVRSTDFLLALPMDLSLDHPSRIRLVGS
jgi:hypothetical protein